MTKEDKKVMPINKTGTQGGSISKLLKPKEWLTLSDAAVQLSGMFEEEVSEADILDLALKSKLQLSVYFTSSVPARCGKFSLDLTKRIFGSESYEPPSFAQVFYADFQDDIRDFFERDFPEIPFEEGEPDNADNDPRGYFALAIPLGTPKTIQGLYDLALSCGGRDDVWIRLCELRNMTYETPAYKQSIVVLGQNGEMCEILEQCSNDQPSTTASYQPARNLPNVSNFVVRSSALMDFVQSIAPQSNEAPKPMTSSERNSLLTVIAALCDYSSINIDERGAATQIAKRTEEIGAPVSDDTVRRILTKIHDAVERRSK